MSFDSSDKNLEVEKQTESDADSFIPSEFNRPNSKDILQDIAEADQRDEDAYFLKMVQNEKRNTMSLSIHIKRNTAIDRLIERKCYTCNTLQPPYVFHCPTCRRCVAYMDHHCPWVNNCVGYFNQKAFVLFCGYGAITLCYGSVIMTKLYNA